MKAKHVTRALLFATALLSGCDREPANSAVVPASPSLNVSLITPQMREFSEEIVASGSVAAWEEVQLGVELNGVRVAEVLVDVGAAVKRGQALVKLDQRTLTVELRQADAAVAEAAAALVLARSNAERGRMLVQRKLISAQEGEQVGSSVLQAQARLNSSQAQREGAQLRVEFATLRAPYDGVIARRDVQPGQVAMAGAEMLRLIRDARLEWRADLPEAEFLRVQVGQRVELDSAGGTRSVGTVRTLGAALDPTTRTGLIYADLKAPGALRAGMFAQGRIQLGVRQNLSVPQSALVQLDGYSYVYSVDAQSRAVRHRVELGASVEGQREVRSGIKAEQQLVERGAGFIGAGDLLRVVNAKDAK